MQRFNGILRFFGIGLAILAIIILAGLLDAYWQG